MGNALFVKGRTAEALSTVEEALDIARRNGEKRSEARALVNLGSIRIQTGDMARGWHDVQTALAYYRQGSYRTEAALALILLGRAARDKGDYEGARRAFEETLATLKPAEPSLPLALAQEGLASLELLQDRWPQALRMFDETRHAFEAIGNSSGVATNQLNVALTHAMLGHQGDATAVSQQAAESDPLSALQIILIQEHFGEARAKAEALLRSADASDLERGAAPPWRWASRWPVPAPAARGLEACRKAFELAKATGKSAEEADALLAWAEAALAAGDRTEAAESAGRARGFARIGQAAGSALAGLCVAAAIRHTRSRRRRRGHRRAGRTENLLAAGRFSILLEPPGHPASVYGTAARQPGCAHNRLMKRNKQQMTRLTLATALTLAVPTFSRVR